MPGAHQITARVLTRPHQITRSLLLQRGHPHQSDLAQPKQPRQALRITPISLDPVGRRTDPRRRCDNAADPGLSARSRQPVPRRPCLIDNTHRRRQRLQPRDGLATGRRESQRTHLTARTLDHARDHRASVHIEPNPATFAHNRRLP